MPKFIITTTDRSINDPSPDARVQTSSRRSRAIRHARKLRAAGNRSIMLFEDKARRDGEESWQPVSLKELAAPRFASKDGCNSWQVDTTPLSERSTPIRDMLKHAKVRAKGRKEQAA